VSIPGLALADQSFREVVSNPAPGVPPTSSNLLIGWLGHSEVPHTIPMIVGVAGVLADHSAGGVTKSQLPVAAGQLYFG
jgi:hypothetical protein